MQGRTTDSGERVVLSNSQTWFLRFVAWWLLPALAAGTGILLAPTGSRPLFFVGALGAAALLWWTGGRLHKVTATPDGLLISNYRVVVEVPYTAIGRVVVSRPGWPAELCLKESTSLGSSIRFLPGPLEVSLGDPSAVVFIRQRVEAVKRLRA